MNQKGVKGGAPAAPQIPYGACDLGLHGGPPATRIATPAGQWSGRTRNLMQRKGRQGWYACVSVPRPLWGRLKRHSVVVKAGDTLEEARRALPYIELEQQHRFDALLGREPLGEIPAPLPRAGRTEPPTHRPRPQAQWGDSCEPDPIEQGPLTWEQWIEERQKAEQRRASTVGNWRSHLKQLAQWWGCTHLGGLSRSDAIAYKSHLLERNTQSGVKTALAALKGFWSWAVLHEEAESNVWQGLSRGLAEGQKHALPSDELIAQADRKAWEGGDHRYMIQRWKGCRVSESSGLRGCDVDVENGLIRFANWSDGTYTRTLKGGAKDERTVPMHSRLQEFLREHPLPHTNESPLWPKSYKPGNQTWGAGYASGFREKFGFGSHDLRGIAVTRLTLVGISPFLLHELTRHTEPGMSKVVKSYVRPEGEALRSSLEGLM